MQTTELLTRLTTALQLEATAHGFELVGVEQAGGRGTPILRVLLDREEGLDLDAVASANVWVTEILDAQEPFEHAYTLEVSSPGIDRPLNKRDDFTRFVGQTVNLRVVSDEKRKSWTGELVGMQGDDVELLVDGERVSLPYDSIQKARLKGVVDFGKGKEQSA
ncbi:MAG: ribosome maturation factor RimP [Coriobacteriia bacterium]|nr:ribosome maturation factor RimP [Coriobacteriia bacterium]